MDGWMDGCKRCGLRQGEGPGVEESDVIEDKGNIKKKKNTRKTNTLTH